MGIDLGGGDIAMAEHGLNPAEWGGTEWFPAMTAAGLQYFAWVYSPNLYSRLSTDLTLQFTTGNAVVATFDDLTTAQAWLTQMQ